MHACDCVSCTLLPGGLARGTIWGFSGEGGGATRRQNRARQQATRIAEEAKKTAEIEAQRRLIEANGLQAAADAVSEVSDAQARVLCMQVWQQTMAKAIDAGQPVYTSPCGGSDASIAVPSTTTSGR